MTITLFAAAIAVPFYQFPLKAIPLGIFLCAAVALALLSARKGKRLSPS
ncbi:MAG: hypothetical protein AABX89_05080 [Candidatus Thermoplasmatota archaeon]